MPSRTRSLDSPDESTTGETIVIDRSSPDRYRYVCPNGHTNWDKTNSHIWCQSCRRQYEAGTDVDAEHWIIVDKKTGAEIPWTRVIVQED